MNPLTNQAHGFFETSTEPSYWPQPTVCNVGEFFELGTEANPIVIDDEAHPPHMIPDAPVTYADDEFNSVADTEIIATPEFWEKLIDESFTAMSTPEHEGAQHVHSTSLSANISPTGCNAFEEREHSRKPSAPPGDMDDEALKGSDGSHASGNSFGPANTNPENATEYQALPPVDVGIEEYEVKRVLDSHLEQRGCQEPCLFYTVEWVGYNEPSYEPAEYLENAREVVSDFHRRCPEKPGPSSKDSAQVHNKGSQWKAEGFIPANGTYQVASAARGAIGREATHEVCKDNSRPPDSGNAAPLKRKLSYDKDIAFEPRKSARLIKKARSC